MRAVTDTCLASSSVLDSMVSMTARARRKFSTGIFLRDLGR